jgi:hypothetical protein
MKIFRDNERAIDVLQAVDEDSLRQEVATWLAQRDRCAPRVRVFNIESGTGGVISVILPGSMTLQGL